MPSDFLPESFRPGDRVRVRCGLYDHVGTVAEDGWIWANSFRQGGVRKVSPGDFSGGRSILNDGPGPRHPRAVLREWEARAGESYHPLFNNCEHVNNAAHGIGHQSPQVRGLVKSAVVLAARVWLRR